MTTAKGHFISIARSVGVHARYKNSEALDRYLDSQLCWERLVALKDAPAFRRRALKAIADASHTCTTALDARGVIPPPGKRRIQWDADTIARFQKVLKRGGVEAAARALGISMGAAVCARRRYGLEPIQQKTSQEGRTTAG